MARKKLVSECWALDIRQLHRGGRLIPDSRLEWAWQDQARGRQAEIMIRVAKAYIELRYRLGPEHGNIQIKECIPLVWVAHGRYGQRVCFVCLGCLRRCAILYAAQAYFRCRRCARVGYPSQYPRRIRSYGRNHRWVRQ